MIGRAGPRGSVRNWESRGARKEDNRSGVGCPYLEFRTTRRMAGNSALEVRVELFADGALPADLATKIGAFLSERWPVTWDVVMPPHPNLDHPAEWRGVIPVAEGATAESLHREIALKILALDASRSLHLRTRWSPQESPDQREVYEERWTPGRP